MNPPINQSTNQPSMSKRSSMEQIDPHHPSMTLSTVLEGSQTTKGWTVLMEGYLSIGKEGGRMSAFLKQQQKLFYFLLKQSPSGMSAILEQFEGRDHIGSFRLSVKSVVIPTKTVGQFSIQEGQDEILLFKTPKKKGHLCEKWVVNLQQVVNSMQEGVAVKRVEKEVDPLEVDPRSLQHSTSDNSDQEIIDNNIINNNNNNNMAAHTEDSNNHHQDDGVQDGESIGKDITMPQQEHQHQKQHQPDVVDVVEVDDEPMTAAQKLYSTAHLPPTAPLSSNTNGQTKKDSLMIQGQKQSLMKTQYMNDLATKFSFLGGK
eukprot:m.70528 g.70528  ORF g.70528 m.70528 type:complete len:316 (+) comp8313_c0_seq3:117-1064(+)